MKRLYVIVLITLLGLTPVAAKKLYKYQDQQGKWYFSDQPPKTPQKVEIEQITVEHIPRVRLLKRGGSSNPVYEIQNDYNGPIEVEVRIVKGKNVRSIPTLPNRFVVAPLQSKPIFNISAVNPRQSFSYSLRYRFTLGSPEARYDASYPYLPPIAPGMEFKISQAFGGPYTHSGDQNKFAVDIVMPEQTPVHAARAGIVMDVEKDYIKGGTNSQAFASRANSIRILHDDGSMALYAHLALEKAEVFPGLPVQQGQLIAYSGNTGYSSGPHLHFSVQANTGMKLASVPFKFIDSLGGVKEPEAGLWLTGFE